MRRQYLRCQGKPEAPETLGLVTGLPFRALIIEDRRICALNLHPSRGLPPGAHAPVASVSEGVAQIFTSSNPLISWLRQLDALRRVAQAARLQPAFGGDGIERFRRVAPVWHVRGAFGGLDFEVIERHVDIRIIHLMLAHARIQQTSDISSATEEVLRLDLQVS